MLEAIYDKFGRYTESMTSVVKKGKDGAAEIKAMMADYRNNPPKEMEGKKVVEIRDYQMLKATNYVDGTVKDIDMPVSDVLQFFLEDGTKLSVRPSGTEPKIKYYRSEHNNI